MTTLLAVIAVFAVLLAPFFLFLVVLRFVPAERRQAMVAIKPLTGVKIPRKLAAFLNAFDGFIF